MPLWWGTSPPRVILGARLYFNFVSVPHHITVYGVTTAEQVNLWNESAWWLELVFNVLMLLLPTLAALAVTSVFGKKVISTFRDVWKEWLRPAVDQPTDPLVLVIAQRTGLSPEVVSAWLVINLDNIVDTLPLEELATAKGADLLRKFRDAGVDV